MKDAVVVILAYDYSDELAKQGSGVVLNDKGYVVTNYHILSGCERLEIMHGKEIIPYVGIIGIDVEKDILILKIEEKKFPSVKIGDTKALKVGQRVYAIGNPMGFENTISEGIISGLRNYEDLRKNYIQITASISSGSSGGAVVNVKGELIGISTLTATEGQNLNFAIPIDEVFRVKIGTYSKDNSFKNFELFNKGLKAAENGNHYEAIEYYSGFIEIYPFEEGAYNNRGLAKTDLGDLRGAIQDYNKAIEINPYSVILYVNRGYAKDKFEDYLGAVNDYNKAIEIDSQFAGAYHNRGITKKKLKDYRGAIEDYSKAIDIDSSNEDVYVNRGNAKALLEDYYGGIIDYNKALEIHPKYALAYKNRGSSKFYLGDKKGACLDWSEAGELGDYDAYDLIREYCN